MARYGIVSRAETVSPVIFKGAPSQLINLPTFIKGALALIVICVGYTYVSMHQPIPWFIPVILFVLVLAILMVAYLQIRFTEFIIDPERITLRKGILNRTVNSVELYRIQDVTSVHPWWQRMFGIGAVIVMTSDTNNPVWRLPGMKDAEQLRNELNKAAIELRNIKGVQEVNMGRV